MKPRNLSQKTPIEFYSTTYSVYDLIQNYTFNQLMEYYSFGVDILDRLNYITENNLYFEVGETPDKVWDDKTYFIMRTTIVKNAIKSIDPCQIITHSNMVFVHYLN